ncbi:MAG: hypothetical protein H6828_09010 [Planctomycetes bacterium]|nr:hypothetical protein [Planctomycetota bacterium]
MSRKSRLLRILLILLGLVLFVGYFAFSTFLFNPFEGRLGVDVSGLVPRSADFFVARARLNDVFSDFPTFAVEEELAKQPAWQAFDGSPEQQELAELVHWDELMSEVRRAVADLPAGLDPLSVFGGDDLAIAGNFRGSRLADAEWAVYGTLSNTGKLAIEMLNYPGVLGLEEQGVTVTVLDDFVTLNGPALSQPLHVGRVRDVAVISNSSQLVAQAIELEARQFKDSFLAGSTYNDRIAVIDRNDRLDELEVFVNGRQLMETLKVSGAYPDAKSPDVLPALVGKFFQLATLNQVAGVLGIDEGLQLDLHGTFSTELMTPLQERVYRRRAASGEELVDEMAIFAPSDSALFVYVKCDMSDLFTQVLNSIEPAARGLIEDELQKTGKYTSLAQVVEELDSALLDRCVLVVRDNDYPPDPDGPPHDAQPVPAVGLVFWVAEGGNEKIVKLRDAIGGRGPAIGLVGRKPGESGYYSNFVGGHEIREFWTPAIPGTGVIATGITGEVCLVTNSFRMIDHLYKTWTQGAPSFPRLSERPDFGALARSSKYGANLAVWVDPGAAVRTLEKQARQRAEDSIEIDWALERAQTEAKVLRDQYGGRSKDALGEVERTDFESDVDAKLSEIETNIKSQQIPALMAQYEREFTYMKAVRGALLMLALDPKFFDLSMRLVAPLEK